MFQPTTPSLRYVSDYSVSERVLTAVAGREGVDPLDLQPRLYDVIDPDALDALFHVDGASGSVAFTFGDSRVTVYSDGDIDVVPIDG